MTQLTTDALFTQYLHVVNAAIGKHRGEFPYGPMIDLGERMLAGKKIGAAVYKDDPDQPHEFFTLKFSGGTFDLVSHGQDDDIDTTWKVKERHLQNVVDDPQTYEEQPYKLDLDWLKTRLGIEA